MVDHEPGGAPDFSDDPFGMLEGTKPIEEDDDNTPSPGGEDGEASTSPEPEADAETQPESETQIPPAPDSEVPAEDPEAAPPPASESEPSSASAPPQDAAPEGSEQSELDKEKARNRALRQRLIKQRQRMQEMQRQGGYAPQPGQGQPQLPPQPPPPPGAPVPVQYDQYGNAYDAYGNPVPAPPQQPQAPPGVPVQLTPDGQMAYVPQDALATQQRQMFEEQSRAQIRARTAAMENAFVSADPGSREPLLESTQAADQFLDAEIRMGLMDGSIVPPPPELQGTRQRMQWMVDQLEEAGLKDQVAEFWPEIGQDFQAFVSAWTMNDPSSKREVLERMAASRSPRPPAGGNGATTPVERVLNGPTSPARMGEGRAPHEDETGDRAEFQRLFDKLTSAPERFTPEERKRMDKLGRQLDIDSF